MNTKRWLAVVLLGLGSAAFLYLGKGWPQPTLDNTAREGPVRTAKDLLANLDAAGYDALAVEYLAKAAPCVHLADAPAPSTGRFGIRIGGLPDLPDASLWPTHDGKHLAFLMQINLEELHGLLPDAGLPEKGMLYFFCEAVEPPWGFDPKDKGRSRVLYVDTLPQDAAQPDFPTDLPKEGRFQERPLAGTKSDSVPELPSLHAFSKLPMADKRKVAEWDHELRTRTGPSHQLAGLPKEIQGDMRLECQLASNGIYCGDKDGGANDPRAKALAPGANDWCLLLQIDSDDAAGMMWGDAGMLYFWIKEDDLKNRRFENAWMILQCN